MIQARVGLVPIATIAGIVVLVLLEIALRRTRWGVQLRAVGSHDAAAARLGIRVGWVRFLSYVLCSLLVLPAAVILMAQIGIGDGRPSLSYTLASVTVVVLAGTSIFGGADRSSRSSRRRSSCSRSSTSHRSSGCRRLVVLASRPRHARRGRALRGTARRRSPSTSPAGRRHRFSPRCLMTQIDAPRSAPETTTTSLPVPPTGARPKPYGGGRSPAAGCRSRSRPRRCSS